MHKSYFKLIKINKFQQFFNKDNINSIYTVKTFVSFTNTISKLGNTKLNEDCAYCY